MSHRKRKHDDLANVPPEDRMEVLEPFLLSAMLVEAAGSVGHLLYVMGRPEDESFIDSLYQMAPPSRGGRSARAEVEKLWPRLVALGIETFGPDAYAEMQELIADAGERGGRRLDIDAILREIEPVRAIDDPDLMEELGWL